MEGSPADHGISPRSVSQLFTILEKVKNEWTYVLSFSMLEIYNETILDLLDNHANKVELLITCARTYMQSVHTVYDAPYNYWMQFIQSLFRCYYRVIAIT